MNEFNIEFKIKVAIEAIRKEKTLAEIAKIYEVPTYLVTKWQGQLLESAKEIFAEKQNENQSQTPQLTEQTDEKLFEMHLEGNKEAFGLIYDRYKEFLKRKAYQQIPDEFEAEDIAQESLVALSFTKTFDRAMGSIRQYLCGIVNKKIGTWFRKNAKLEVFDIREEQLRIEQLVRMEEISNSTSYKSISSFWNNLRSQKSASVHNQLMAYLIGEVKNRQFEYFRKGGHNNYLSILFNNRPELEDPERIFIKTFLIGKLKEEVNKLPTLQKEALSILIEDDSNYLELAAKMGITIPYFKTLIHRARKMMRERFGYRMEDVPNIGKWRISN